MISWPGHISPAHVQNFAHAIDLFPTIASMVGLEAPEHLPGINLTDKKSREDRKIIFGVCNSVFTMTPDKPDETLQYLWCIEGDWKLLVRYHGKDPEIYRALHEWDTAAVHLFDLKNDPHEKSDLAQAHPKIVASLKKKIETWHRVSGK